MRWTRGQVMIEAVCVMVTLVVLWALAAWVVQNQKGAAPKGRPASVMWWVDSGVAGYDAFMDLYAPADDAPARISDTR